MKEFKWFEWFEWFGPSPTEPFNSGQDLVNDPGILRLCRFHDRLALIVQGCREAFCGALLRVSRPMLALAQLSSYLTLKGSFSAAAAAVSKPNCAKKYSLETSRRDQHNALLCTVLLDLISIFSFFRHNGPATAAPLQEGRFWKRSET